MGRREMKLAEALAERKAIKTRMEGLKKRIYQNSKVQEGDTPIEEPLALLPIFRLFPGKFPRFESPRSLYEQETN
jgi:hypothetical protein